MRRSSSAGKWESLASKVFCLKLEDYVNYIGGPFGCKRESKIDCELLARSFTRYFPLIYKINSGVLV
jgi:hypothetical protein